MEDNNQSIHQEAWAEAQKVGAERIDRVENKVKNVIEKIVGIDAAAKKYIERGTEVTKAKYNEIKDKAIDLKERTENKINETREKMVNRFEAAKDNFVSRVEAFKKKVNDKAAELKKRAVAAGVKTGFNIEERVVKILELPAGLKEARATKIGEKVVRREKTIEETKAEQFAEMKGFTESQKEALIMFLESQKEEKGMLEEEHQKTREEMSKDIPVWKEKKTKLEADAIKRKENIEKGRVFKKLLEKTK